jgi:hypothetical protein
VARRTNLIWLKRALEFFRPSHFDRPEIVADEGLDYLKLASRCRSQNSFNRLHIELENVCTPIELAGLARLALEAEVPRATLDWLAKLNGLKSDLLSAPHTYRRRSFSNSIFLYQDLNSHLANKGLLVAFTGLSRRLMMPIPIFLQFVDPSKWDVLVLSEKSERCYLHGLEHISTNFPDLIDYVRRTFSPAKYDKLFTIGTSAGGFAAIWAALLLDANRGVSVGGFLPEPLPDLRVEKPIIGFSNLWFVYGVDYPQDVARAFTFQKVFGGQLFPIAGVNSHNILGTLLKRGEFSEFLGQVLINRHDANERPN